MTSSVERLALTHDEVRSVLDTNVATVRRPITRATTRIAYGGVLRRDVWGMIDWSVAHVEAFEDVFAIVIPGHLVLVQPCWDTRGPLHAREEWCGIDRVTGYAFLGYPPRDRTIPVYRVGASDLEESLVRRWIPAAQMPVWASRLRVQVTSVRAEKSPKGTWRWVLAVTAIPRCADAATALD